MSKLLYAGIGPRTSSPDARSMMTAVGKQLADLGFMLSSGDGIGSDQAWAEEVPVNQQRIFLAEGKPNCEHGIVPSFLQDQWAFADKHFGKHRGKKSLTTQSAYVQYLFMRNLNILLGEHLNDPVSFVAYWYQERHPNGWASGTGHTVSMARDKDINIPCFNIYFADEQQAMEELVTKLLEEKEHVQSIEG